MAKKITIEIVTKDDDDLDVNDTLTLIGGQIANGFLTGFDRREDERYYYDVSDVNDDEL